jgi:hypothetical protein
VTERTATIYVLESDFGCTLAVDCDTCHGSLLDWPVTLHSQPTVTVGSGWVRDAVAAHQGTCPGGPIQDAS